MGEVGAGSYSGDEQKQHRQGVGKKTPPGHAENTPSPALSLLWLRNWQCVWVS